MQHFLYNLIKGVIILKQEYYDGTKLLSLSDINGDKPELYLCTTNRTGGKTTYFGRYCVNRFIKKGEKFGLIYRYNYELDDCADKFFKDLSNLFHNTELENIFAEWIKNGKKHIINANNIFNNLNRK